MLEMYRNYIINIWRGFFPYILSSCVVRVGLYIIYPEVLQCCDFHCRNWKQTPVELRGEGLLVSQEGLYSMDSVSILSAACGNRNSSATGVYEPMMLNWYVAMCLFWYSKFREFVLIFNFELIKWKHRERVEDWWKRTWRIQYPLLLLIVGNNSSGTNWR